MSVAIAAVPSGSRAAAPRYRPGQVGGGVTRPRHLQVVKPGFRPRPAMTEDPLPASRPAAEVVETPITGVAPMRLTARGRSVLAAVAFVAAAMVAGIAGAALGGVHAGAQAQVSADAQYVTVQPGETLWSIAAAAAAPGDDVRDLVAEIMSINDLTSAQVMAGQPIQVPVRG